MPQTEPKHNFDIDLDFGQIWERRICNIFENNGSLEVKADRMWWNSGNLAFEFQCNGKPSGIAASKATWWVSVLTNQDDPNNTDLILIWKTEELKELLRSLIREKKAEVKNGGDGMRAQLVLVKIDDLLPSCIHDKPWSNRKDEYARGFQDGVKQQNEFYANMMKNG